MSGTSSSNINDWNRRVIEEFRANGGKAHGRYEGVTLLLLTTTGKKSGQPRIAPLAYQLEGDRLVVVASYMGSPKHPDWYLNLVAQPRVTVEVGQEKFAAIATTVTDPQERARLLKQWPMVREHQELTAREIPFVFLQRTESPDTHNVQ